MNTIESKILTNYWKEKLKGKKSYNFEFLTSLQESRVLLKAQDVQYFTKLTSGNDTVMYTVFLSVFNILLKRYFQEVYLISARFFTVKNGLPFLYNAHDIKEATVKESLQKSRAEIQLVYQHADHEPGIKTDANYTSFEDYTPFSLWCNAEANEKQKIPFILKIKKQNNNDFELCVSFAEAFVKADVAVHFVMNFKNWIEKLEQYINEQATSISLLTTQEKEQILKEFNNTSSIHPIHETETLVDLIEKQVSLTPQNIAVVFENDKFTYQQINEKANQLAFYLREKYDINPGDFVGVKLSRSEQLVVAILAILKAGAAYVPVDTAYPQARIAYIEKDSNSKVLIDETFIINFDTVSSNFSEKNPEKVNTGQDLAYLIYTSGTTGNPKGVMITHHNAVAFVRWAQDEFNPSAFDIIYAATSHCFDLSVFEMFYTLSIGSTMRILNNALEIGNYLQHERKVLLNTVPSVIRKLITDENADKIKNISVLNLAGEPFPADIAQKLSSMIPEVRNLYGPSEDTTYSTAYKVLDKEYINVPIGKPITNTQAYILDENLELLPIGVTGKLYVAGAGLAKGYLNRPDLTNERFIDDPFQIGRLMYDTGDMAQWLPDGNIIFLGRKDAQVKLRGYRIELAEIETVLSQVSPNIKQVVCDIKSIDGEQLLVAYYVSEKSLDQILLREQLSEKLPGYMIPNFYIELNAIPLSPNGKTDRKALPEITEENLNKSEYVAPRNQIEEMLVTIWQEVLGIKKIGINDHFFELGGHSLMISQLINKVYKTLGRSIPFKVFYTDPTIASISQSLKKDLFVPIANTTVADVYPVTPSQHRLWILSQTEEGALAYLIPSALAIEGNINISNFKKAFNHVIDRHEILRSYFEYDDQEILKQWIVPKSDFNFVLSVEDFSSLDTPGLAVESYIKEQLNNAFDLSAAPLFSASLLKTSNQSFVFFFLMHHIISDGWSLEILTSEFIDSYKHLQAGEDIILPELPIQFKDYAAWLLNDKKEDKQIEAKEYWLKVFQGEIPVLKLPGSTVRPLVKTFAGRELNYCYSNGILSKLKYFSKTNQVTVFTTLMAGIKILLSRYANQNVIIIGTPVAGREHPDLENQIGLYVNTLAIRTEIRPEESFSDLLQREKQQLLEAYAHQHFPFDELVRLLNLTNDTSRSPLFDVMVVLQNQNQLTTFQDRNELKDLVIKEYPIPRETSQFDLSFAFIEKEGLSLSISYNLNIYHESFVKVIFLHLENLLNQILVSPDIPIGNIDLLTSAEKQKLLVDFNNTKVDYPLNQTVIDLFEEQVERSPEVIAVVYEEEKLTFKQLDEVSSQLSNYLRIEFDVQSGDLVGIKLERSNWMILSILGILKSCCGYLPIDPQYPQERIDYIVTDSNCKLCIDDDFLKVFIEKKATLHSSRIAMPIGPDSLAYVIYTSGSTGLPKGVLNNHAGLYNRLLWMRDELKIGQQDVILQKTPYTFDVSVWELLMPLITGSKLVFARPDGHKDPIYLQNLIEQKNISIIHFVPSMLDIFLSEVSPNRYPGLHHVVCSGEALSLNTVEKFRQKLRTTSIHNLYGPTEAAIDVTYVDLTNPDSTNNKVVPIGRPVANTHIYIVNEKMQLQPIGMEGELVIGGIQVAKGYLNRPELSKEKFTNSPFEEGERLYKTGDLARWHDDGNIEFIGRKDDQVKIRGYRVELGEIESALTALPEVKQCAVVVKKQVTDPAIAAYIVSDIDLDKQLLRTGLSKKLPEHMIPSYFVRVEAIPLTQNGKVNKSVLPDVGAQDIVQREYIAPGNSIEAKMAAIWEDVLGVEDIGITDNFFELGGHSLKATLLVNRVKRLLGLILPFKDLFLYPTISGIVSRLRKSSYESIPKALSQDSYVLTPAQRRMWVLSQFQEGNFAYNIPGTFKIRGPLDVDKMNMALRIIISRHDSLRAIFNEDNNGDVRQYIIPFKDVNFAVCQDDLTDAVNQSSALTRILEKAYSYVFNLREGPLFKVGLVKLSPQNYLMWFNMHHMISDGWSMEILQKEFMVIYSDLMNNRAISLPSLSIQYQDYAEWLHSAERHSLLASSEEYWLSRFSDNPPVLELPIAKARPKIKAYSGDSVSYRFSDKLSHDLRLFGKQHRASLFMVLMSGINGLFSRYCHTGDITLGTPVAGRDHPNLEDQIGLYLNTLAIRTQFELSASFEELLSIQKVALMDAYTHQSYPFDSLVDKLDLRFDTSRSPLFDVLVVLQNQQGLLAEANLPEGDLELLPYTDFHRKISQFDIVFNFWEQEDQLNLCVEFNTDIYLTEFINRMILHLERLLQGCISAPNQRIETIDYLTDEEKQQLLYDFNETQTEFPSDKTIVDLFREYALRTPNTKAVIFGDRELTYAELDKLSNQFARCLINDYGVSVGNLIGVQLDRSELLVVSILGILKSGAAYIPIDPQYPIDRKHYMIDNASVTLLITETAYLFDLEYFEGTLLAIDVESDYKNYISEPPVVAIKPSDLAYGMYTSGSTGKPKGILIEHKSIIRLVKNTNYVEIAEGEKVLGLSSFSFDGSTFDFYIPLLNGGTLVISSKDLILNLNRFGEYLEEKRIAAFFMTTALFNSLVESEQKTLGSLRYLIIGGEQASVKHVKRFKELYPNIRLVNGYGPTENTTFSAYYVIDNLEPEASTVPIGSGISNSTCYILDSNHKLVPIGIVGEICLGGAGLARGYLNAEDLTAEKFIPHPYLSGERIYKTGDLGRWREDGNIECIGRKDDQVKIRGYRIELGEIESALMSLSQIQQAVVLVKKLDTDPVIVAYIVSDMDLDKQYLRSSLIEKLPEYMIPAYFVRVATMPLTLNGKVNKTALPDFGVQDMVLQKHAAPTNAIEEQLVIIWEELLGIEGIGVTDNFFELGGHSLKAIKAIMEIQRKFNVKVEIETFFQKPDIMGLAEEIANYSWQNTKIEEEKITDRIII